MKNRLIILSGIALTVLLILLYNQKNLHSTKKASTDNISEVNHSDQFRQQATEKNSTSSSTEIPTDHASTQNTLPAVKKENNCFRFSYQHEEKNQNRDIEDFLNDTNAFPIANANVNQKSICVKVNDKPVNHKFVKKDGKAEVIIGSVVGPESTIQVSYCVGSAPCKESCIVKLKNKVDELLNDSEMGGLENSELEVQVKELRKVASVHGDLMDSTIIRNWNQLQSKEWVCEK